MHHSNFLSDLYSYIIWNYLLTNLYSLIMAVNRYEFRIILHFHKTYKTFCMYGTLRWSGSWKKLSVRYMIAHFRNVFGLVTFPYLETQIKPFPVMMQAHFQSETCSSQWLYQEMVLLFLTYSLTDTIMKTVTYYNLQKTSFGYIETYRGDVYSRGFPYLYSLFRMPTAGK